MNQGSAEPIFHTTCDLLFEYTFSQTIDRNVRANIPLKWDTSLNRRQPVFHSRWYEYRELSIAQYYSE